MAKETMQAISDAESQARQAVLNAKEEGERLVSEAASQGEQAIAAAVKEARKKSDVLCGVARADAEKLSARVREETLSQQESLRRGAEENRGKVVDAVRKVVLGEST